MRRRPPTLLAAALYLLAVAAIALWPTPVDASIDVMGSWPVRLVVDVTSMSPQQAYDLVQFSANIVLFAPLGWFAMVLVPGTAWWRVALAGVAVSAGVELLQLGVRPERVASWVDVVANGLGAAIGAALAVLALRERPIRRT